MNNDKRKLTEKKLKRKNDFEKLSSEMQQKGYKMKNVVINTPKAKYVEKVAISVRNCYAYIGFRRWGRFSTYTEKYINR